MIRNLLVVHISGLGDSLKAPIIQDFRREPGRRSVAPQSADVLMYLLGHCRGQHSGICPRIGNHLFLIQLLNYPQSLIGTNLEELGAVILQLRQVVEQGRILVLLFPADALHQNIAHRRFFQMRDQPLRVRLFLKAILLVELWRTIPGRFRRLGSGASHRAPFPLETLVLKPEIPQHPVKGSLHKGPDLPLPVHHDSQHAGHDPPHGNHGLIAFQIIFYRISVLQGKRPGEIDSHQVILFRPQVCRVA